MVQHFVITFGGTGARCAEALCYLIASRSINQPVHMLIVDPDETNWSVDEAVKQARRYQSIQKHGGVTGSGAETPLFATPLNEGLGADSFFWANPQPHVPFATLLEYSSLGSNEKALFDLLYDESDLALTFEKGYIGRAHIGSLDLLRTLQTQIEAAARPEISQNTNPDSLQRFFRALRAATLRTEARLLVVGSVFGGTGASGLPAIPPLLRKSFLTSPQQSLTIGCVQLAHYFSFPQGRPEDPDSALHPLATQAALYHYSLTDTGYDRVYLLGAPDREQSSDTNVSGGGGQKNRSHYVELGAALAAAHFFDETTSAPDPEVFACGSDEVTWDKLPSAKRSALRRNLVTLATLCMFHSRFLADSLDQKKHLASTWWEELRASGTRSLGGQEAEVRELRDFGDRFLAWATDLQRCSGVDLFSIGENINVESLAKVTRGGESTDAYHDLMLRLNRVRSSDQRTGFGWYVDALTKASADFCHDNYKSWWT